MEKIKWTNKAVNNLRSIYDYIALDSELYAFRFINSLVKATLKLESLPYCGRVVPELENESIREIIYENYRIVYRLPAIQKVDVIEIIAIVHGARKLPFPFD